MKRFYRLKPVTIVSAVVLFCLVSASAVHAQHEGHTMPGTSKSRPKAKRVQDGKHNAQNQEEACRA